MSATPKIEIVRPLPARRQISHVIFDMDGTLSWLRHGWPEMMYQLFRQYFPRRVGETEQSIHELLLSEILSLNGKPTIYQMMRFSEHVTQRGGSCPKPEELLDLYQSQLDLAIEERIHKLDRGEAKPDQYVVFNAREILEKLTQRGLTLIILSGTIEPRVKHEAGLLGLARYFGKHIYGSTPDPTQFSKRQVIDRILRDEEIQGEHLLSFGDGPVEIQETKAVGGLAVAVASDEVQNGSGIMDPHKRKQLLAAGADVAVADYRDANALIELFFGK